MNRFLNGVSPIALRAPSDGGGAGAGAAGAGTGAGAGVGAGAGSPWYTGEGGLDAELTGHVQAKGWDKLDARAAALAAVKSERAHQQMIGVPADQLLRLPKEPGDTDGWGKVWSRLGRPQDEKGYDFSGVKRADGSDLDEGFANFLRQTAFKHNLPKETAAEFARALTGHLEGQSANAAAERTVQVEEARAQLRQSWGANFDANRIIAQNAFKALMPASGLAPEKYAEAMTALEAVVGYDGLHQVLLTIGQKIGEDKFIGGRGPNGDGIMTREQAVARKSELMKDAGWTQKYLGGDTAAQREMQTLNRLIVGV